MTEGNEKGKLTVKQIKVKFKIGKIKEYDVLKAKSEIRNHWFNCYSG
jgi:hypothetical protein